jgi:hypothetical protein
MLLALIELLTVLGMEIPDSHSAEGHDEFKALTLDNRAPLHIGVVHHLCRDTEQFGECKFGIAITGILRPRERCNVVDPTTTEEPGESD